MLVLKTDHDKPIASVALSACGRWLAAVRYTVAVDVWDRAAGRVAFTHEGRSGTWGVAFEPTTECLLVWGFVGLSVYSLPQFRLTSTTPKVSTVEVADGRLVGLADWDRCALVGWRPALDKLRPDWLVPVSLRMRRIALDPTGRWFMAVQDELAVRSVADGAVVHTTPAPPNHFLLGLLDDRQGLFAVGRGMRVYDVAAACTVSTARLLGGLADVAAVAPDGQRVVVRTRAGLFLLATDPLRVITHYTFPTAGRPTCVAFAPDGLTATCGTSKGEVVIWDVD